MNSLIFSKLNPLDLTRKESIRMGIRIVVVVVVVGKRRKAEGQGEAVQVLERDAEEEV